MPSPSLSRLALPGRSRAEQVLIGAGLLSVAVAAAVWAFLPAAPPPKGGGPSAPRLDMLLAFFAGTLLVAGTVRSAADAWRTRSWTLVQGVLSDVRPVERAYVYLTGEYVANGRPYRLQDVRYRLGGTYRVGEPIALRYNPASPETAAFQPLVSRTTAATLVAGVLLLVGSGIVLVGPSLA